MSNLSDILFWLDQEPADSIENVFLPADTPIHSQSSKILYQKHIKQQKREGRTLNRINNYYYCKLRKLRKDTAAELRSKPEPEDSLVQYIHIKDCSDFSETCTGELDDLMSYLSKVKSGEITNFVENMDTATEVAIQPKDSKSEIETIYDKGHKKLLEEYSKICQEFGSSGSNASSSPSRIISPTASHTSHHLISTSSTKPLQTAERIMPRDPRLF